jgi:hypothetical protein
MERRLQLFFTHLVGFHHERIADPHHVEEVPQTCTVSQLILSTLAHTSKLAPCCYSIEEKTIDKIFELNWIWMAVEI